MEANAELEANALAQLIEGKRKTVRALSSHRGIDPADPDQTAAVLSGERARLSEEAATLSLVERSPGQFSKGTNETIVEVTVEPHRDGYAVVISDDGPGIPDSELDAIEAGTETELRHSRGLGLWQLKWSVEKLNGDLSFETDPGTTVRITIPDLDGGVD